MGREYGVEAAPGFSVGERFAQVLAAAHAQSGERCVVLVDEYDKPLLDVMDSGFMTDVDGNRITVEERNRDVLKSFYSVFKKADADLQFVFLTGVTKFAQISVFSGFNQPEDISMSPQYDTLCGITEDELDRYFKESVAQMAALEGVAVDEMRSMLRKRYDGYNFSTMLRGVYNPFSLLCAFKQLMIKDYWFATGARPILSGFLTILTRILMNLLADITVALSSRTIVPTSSCPCP